ncbi:membrane protein insertion efficiency factor YidD [candidate division KSB1 bacterium]|nr:membrane protein insertion efficiency factor YidD [candidate division KSB1 bacterium]
MQIIFSYAAKAAAHACIAFIRLYQLTISPLLPNCCRYHPTCSDYALQAIKKYGVVKGVMKSLYRILRCNPFSSGGYDPV